MNLGNKPSFEVKDQPTMGYPLLEIRYDGRVDTDVSSISAAPPVMRRVDVTELLELQPVSFWQRIWILLNMDIRDLWWIIRRYWRH